MLNIARNLIVTTITIIAFGTSPAFAISDASDHTSCREAVERAASSCSDAAFDAASMVMDFESGDAASLGMDASNFGDDAEQCASDVADAADACTD